MGLFGKKIGKAIKGLFSSETADAFAAAQATLGGDYAGAASIRQNGALRRQKLKEAEAEAEQQRQLHSMIDSDPNLPTPEAKMYAKANPKAYIQAYMSRFETRQFGPGGGSVRTPGANGPQWEMAPSRMEYQGSVADIGPAVPGQKATVTPQHEGTQWITPQPGTTAFGVNSFSGLPRTGASAAAPPAPTAGPAPGTVEDGHVFKGGDPADPSSWVPLPQGGAGFTAPRTFPY